MRRSQTHCCPLLLKACRGRRIQETYLVRYNDIMTTKDQGTISAWSGRNQWCSWALDVRSRHSPGKGKKRKPQQTLWFKPNT